MDSFTKRLEKLGYKSYSAYLRSEHWKEFKQRYAASGRSQRCASCFRKSCSLHHQTYRNLGHEELDDVVPLCQPCHAALHQLSRNCGISIENTARLLALMRTGEMPIQRRWKRAPIGLIIKDKLKAGMPYADAVRYAYAVAGKPAPACLDD